MDKSAMKNLKLNYHLLEACNFGCKFCFARYADKSRLDFDQMRVIIKKVADSGFFSGINFAGGEPFLIKQLPELIKFAKKCGLETSVITNGSLLTKEILESVLPSLDCIGISIHSVFKKTKKDLGFCSKDGQVLTNKHLYEIYKYIRQHSECKIKVNTVVNSFNKNEIISDFVTSLSVDRWKVLRCQSFGCNKNLLVSDLEWENFCKRNCGFSNTVFEDNMKDTYIMADPMGNLLKENSQGNGYLIIGSVLTENIEALLLEHPLHINEYRNRYVA